MRMYCPSLKENVEATITDGKEVASKGGSLRNILYGELEGRKCLPKTVKAEVFAQHGFAAESNFDKLSHEIAEEYEEKGKTPEEAQEIGDATAAKIGRMKYGKKKFDKMGKKAEYEDVMKDVENLSDDDYVDFCQYWGIDPDDTEELSSFLMKNKDSPDVQGWITGRLIGFGAETFEAETFEAYDDPISDRQEWKINSLGGTVDSSMNRSEASDYIKELQGRKSGTWKEAESSPSSFDISWEDAQGVSSPSLPPEGIHFAEGEYVATMCDSCEAIYPESDYEDSCECGGKIRNLFEYDDGSADFESEYNLNGENCEYCAEARELNAEGFCSECAHHADYFNARSYEDAFRSESVSYASEGLTRNGKFALGLTALGVGIAMAMGSEKVASLLDKINGK